MLFNRLAVNQEPTCCLCGLCRVAELRQPCPGKRSAQRPRLSSSPLSLARWWLRLPLYPALEERGGKTHNYFSLSPHLFSGILHSFVKMLHIKKALCYFVEKCWIGLYSNSLHWLFESCIVWFPPWVSHCLHSAANGKRVVWYPTLSNKKRELHKVPNLSTLSRADSRISVLPDNGLASKATD